MSLRNKDTEGVGDRYVVQLSAGITVAITVITMTEDESRQFANEIGSVLDNLVENAPAFAGGKSK